MNTAATERREPRRQMRRLLVLGLLGALAVAGGLAYRYFWWSRPIGAGPAGPAVALEPFRTPWSDRKVLLVGLGDSITAGFGASPGHGYFDRLYKPPKLEFADMRGRSLAAVLPNLEARNLALSGSTSQECLDVLIPKLEVQDPETFGVVVLTTGGNDLIHNYGRTPPREGAMYGATLAEAQPWIANFESRLETILDRIEERFPGGSRTYLANVYDPTDGVGDAENAGLPPWPEGLEVIAAYNAVIARVTKRRERVELVDIRTPFLGHGIHCRQFWRPHYRSEDPCYWYYANLEDPNNRGYDAIRRLFLLEMVKSLPSVLQAAH